ncbi:hypothetical protein B0H14DRAFT_2630675 [Mycena olivaceomarginata]|nr:hypothetical protein B0H14DRAFT_2630675 [Mycena olivaceomarginata]
MNDAASRSTPLFLPSAVPDNLRRQTIMLLRSYTPFPPTLPEHSQFPIAASSTNDAPHFTVLAAHRAIHTLSIQFDGSLTSHVATFQIQILALPLGSRSHERGAAPG